MKGYLLLEDGTQYHGEVFGYINQQVGEVVFNTSMTGYQEIITDPSYYNQIVVMTYPLIGNYGIHEFVSQSNFPIVKGFIVRENADVHIHWNGRMSLDEFLKKNKIMGLSGIDTRSSGLGSGGCTRIMRFARFFDSMYESFNIISSEYIVFYLFR